MRLKFRVWPKLQLHNVAVRSSKTVHVLKTRLQVQTGIPIESMYITFNNATLEDGRTLAECFVPPYSILSLYPTGLTFTVKTEMGTEHEVHMRSSDLVQNLEILLREKTQCPTGRQKLMFNGRRLEHDHPLSEYGIQQASVVHMMIHKHNNVSVIVKTMTGKSFYIDLDLCDTVKNLKVKIQDKEGIPVKHMHITFNEKIMKDRHKLSESGIEPKSILNLWIRPRETGLTFTVKTEMRTEHEVHMDSLDPVKTLKLILLEMTQCPINRQKLMFNGRILEDDRLLSEYGIQQASVVIMLVPKHNNNTVIAETLEGKLFYIDLDVCDTWKTLSEKLWVTEGIPINDTWPVLMERTLEGPRPASHNRIEHLSLIHLRPSLRGGGCAKIKEEDDEDDDDVGENRGRRRSMEQLANFNHDKPQSCQIC